MTPSTFFDSIPRNQTSGYSRISFFSYCVILWPNSLIAFWGVMGRCCPWALRRTRGMSDTPPPLVDVAPVLGCCVLREEGNEGGRERGKKGMREGEREGGRE